MSKPELIKICGLSTTEAIDAAIASGATHVGMIFFEKSPRHIELDTASKLSSHTGNRALKVAVTVNSDDESLNAIIDHAKPDVLQLHGNEAPERVMQVKSNFDLPVIKALAISDQKDIENAQRYVGKTDQFLFDAKPPKNANLPGGNGVAFDWQVMDQWPQDVPYILSGGLTVDNIRKALETLKPMGIDLSSGVETAPGQKDPTMIRKFLQIVMQKEVSVE